MGYPMDLIINPELLDEEFICSICSDVMKDPIMITTLGCEHIFCTSCLQDWIPTSNNTCPIDHDPIVGLRPPIRAYMNMYYKIQIKCGFNDCTVTSTLGNIESHISLCQYNPEAMDLCADNCGACIKMKEIPTHNCVQYLKGELLAKDREIIKLRRQVTKNESANSQLRLLKLKYSKLKQQQSLLTNNKYEPNLRNPITHKSSTKFDGKIKSKKRHNMVSASTNGNATHQEEVEAERLDPWENQCRLLRNMKGWKRICSLGLELKLK